MIVPRTRLLVWVALVLIPTGLLTSAVPSAMAGCLAAVAGLVVVLSVDAIRGRRALAPIEVTLAPVVRMSQDRPATLEVRLRNPSQGGLTLRVALVLPDTVGSAQPDLLVAVPGGHEWCRVAWKCVPRKKGRFQVESAHLELASPWDLWDVRARAAARSEVRVYPNLVSERKSLAALFLNRGSVGLHVQRQIGKGREFEKLREYVPGDGFEDVHWKATAKRGKPVTKVFQIERTQEIYVVIDASRLAARTPGRSLSRPADENVLSAGQVSSRVAPPELVTALDRYVAAALVLGLAAEQQGDLFGLLTFSDRIERFLRAKSGKAHFSACRDALYTLQPKPVTPDYEELFSFIRLRLRRRALLVILTALDDPVLAESFTRNLPLLSRQHLVLVNMIQPPGVGPLFEGPEPAALDDLYERLGGHLLWENLGELQKKLERRGVQFTLLQDERLSVQLVHQYLDAKRRQAL